MLRYFCLMHVSDKSIIRRTRRNTLHDLGQLFLEIIHEPAIIFLYECRIVLTVVATNLGNGGILKLENTIEDSFHLCVFFLFHKELSRNASVKTSEMAPVICFFSFLSLAMLSIVLNVYARNNINTNLRKKSKPIPVHRTK